MNNEDKGQIVLFQTEDGQTKLEVQLQDETVWLTIDQMAELFPDFVIVSPKSLRQRVLLFSDVLPSALFGCKSPCSEVA